METQRQFERLHAARQNEFELIIARIKADDRYVPDIELMYEIHDGIDQLIGFDPEHKRFMDEITKAVGKHQHRFWKDPYAPDSKCNAHGDASWTMKPRHQKKGNPISI